MEKIEKIKVIDNFLKKDDFKKIQDIFMSSHIPWYYNDYVISPEYRESSDHYQFIHPFYIRGCVESNFYVDLFPILDNLDYYLMIKCKANLLIKTKTHIEHGYHIDLSDLEKHHKPKTSIFYINTNNGYTKFEDGSIIKSVENRLVTFDTRMEHTGSTCTDENVRIVINFNYF
jgi:hypothetical protein